MAKKCTRLPKGWLPCNLWARGGVGGIWATRLGTTIQLANVPKNQWLSHVFG